jgi:hypothetical protein
MESRLIRQPDAEARSRAASTLPAVSLAGQVAAATRFHPDLYIAAAGAIPVLFLGFAFQRYWLSQIFSHPKSDTTTVSPSAKFVTILLLLSVIAGFVAEGLALVVLLNQTSFPGAGITILISTLYLLLMNIVVMAITWAGTVLGD